MSANALSLGREKRKQPKRNCYVADSSRCRGQQVVMTVLRTFLSTSSKLTSPVDLARVSPKMDVEWPERAVLNGGETL